MTTPGRYSRVAGGLIGVAVGDALGATVEFLTPDQIADRHGTHRDIIGGGTFGWRPGEGTDDTDLTWAVLDAYLDGYTLNGVAKRMLAWYDSRPRDIGGTTSSALLRLKETGDPHTSGATSEHSCGNGSLMRCLPTALIRTDPSLRNQEMGDISAITHAHPRCVESCIAYGTIVATLLEDAPAPVAIDAARASTHHPLVHEALTVPANTDVTDLSTSGYVIDSLRCAVWAIKQTTSFEDTLIALVNQGGDADTTAAIAGGLLGVRDGLEAIPARWGDSIEYRDRMLTAVARLTQIGDDDNSCRYCGDRNDDGEGWDGWCGNCADLIDGHDESDHTVTPNGDCPLCIDTATQSPGLVKGIHV